MLVPVLELELPAEDDAEDAAALGGTLRRFLLRARMIFGFSVVVAALLLLAFVAPKLAFLIKSGKGIDELMAMSCPHWTGDPACTCHFMYAFFGEIISFASSDGYCGCFSLISL